jgi:hypothetical protein
MVTKVKQQIHMEENIVNSPELEWMLEVRQSLKENVSDYRKKDKEVKAKLAPMEEKMPLRCGRFVVSLEKVQPREVSFEINGGTRITIKPVSEDK